MINILFSMDGPALADGELEYFQSFGQWTVLNERDGRLLVDAVSAPAVVSSVESQLTATGRNPAIIGAWTSDGSPVATIPFDEQQWLAVAPDEVDESDPENPVHRRPTEFREIHRWAGWHTKEVTQ